MRGRPSRHALLLRVNFSVGIASNSLALKQSSRLGYECYDPALRVWMRMVPAFRSSLLAPLGISLAAEYVARRGLRHPARLVRREARPLSDGGQTPSGSDYCFSHTLTDGVVFAFGPAVVTVVVMILPSGETVIVPVPVTTPFRLRVDVIV